MSEIDQQFIEYVVKSLVGKPDAVHIDRRIDEKGVLLELTVDPEDLGRVIGKRGATAQSLRTLLRALGTKNDARYNLKIVDNGIGSHENEHSETATTQDSSYTPPATPQPVDGEDTQADDTANDDDVASEEVAEEEVEVEAEAPAIDRFKDTRQELADLDDLDL